MDENKTHAPVQQVVWTSLGQLQEVERGGNGTITSHGDEFMCIPLRVGKPTTAAEAFARWIEEGPKLAKAAGCYVGIKVTNPPPQTKVAVSELDEMVASAIEAAMETSPEFNHGWRSIPEKDVVPEILDEIPAEYTEKQIAEAIYRYKMRRLVGTPAPVSREDTP